MTAAQAKTSAPPDSLMAAFAPGSRVLDVGFGKGEQMRQLAAGGFRVFGIDLHAERALRVHLAGLAVCRARAESIPFLSRSFDAVVCKVVVPYTDEARVIDEIARVLRPGGTARVSYHGLGYPLRILTEPNYKRLLYATRILVNTMLYSLTGRRLPGFLGRGLYQSRRRLRRYYDRHQLELLEDSAAPFFFNAPVFIDHTVRRRLEPATDASTSVRGGRVL